MGCVDKTPRGRYGGRAERGTKTAFRGGMVAMRCGPRTVESDTLSSIGSGRRGYLLL